MWCKQAGVASPRVVCVLVLGLGLALFMGPPADAQSIESLTINASYNASVDVVTGLHFEIGATVSNSYGQPVLVNPSIRWSVLDSSGGVVRSGCHDYPDLEVGAGRTDWWWPTAPETPGTYTVKLELYRDCPCGASCSGDPLDTKTRTIVAARGPTSISVGASSGSSCQGQEVTFTATVTSTVGDPFFQTTAQWDYDVGHFYGKQLEGSVQFYLDGGAWGAPMTSMGNTGEASGMGWGVIVVSRAGVLAAGPHSVYAVYTSSIAPHAGSTSTTLSHATTLDTTPPTISCPAPITQNTAPETCGATVSLSATASDNCTLAGIRYYVGAIEIVSPHAFSRGTTAVTAVATDGVGLTASCGFTVTVIDNEKPTITCQAEVTAPTDPGACSATGVDLGTPTTGDNCGVASVANNAPAQFPKGDTTVTWTVTDTSGNTATCTQTVTVVDDEPPTISCPNWVVSNTDFWACYATGVALGTPTTSDNCGVASVTNNAPARFPKGDTTVTWTVTDTSSNTATCTQRVTVVDTQTPDIVCPFPVYAFTDPRACYATGVALGTPTTSDNCGVASVTNNAPAQFPKGVTTVTWTATDTGNNTAFCTQTVTVVDNEKPTITCPDDVTVSTDVEACHATGVALGTPTTSDNCGVASVTNNAPAQFPKGVTTVTWTVTDTSGNAATCTQTVTVVDGEPPTITCPDDVTVSTDPGVCYATGVDLGIPTTSDNCSVASVTNNAPAQFPKGVTTVTWTVTDTSDNTATCTQTVTVVDNEPPTITCRDIAVELDPSGQATITPEELLATAWDNCGEVHLISLVPNVFTCSDLGQHIVTLTAQDGSQNSTSCQAAVVVRDTIGPTILRFDISSAWVPEACCMGTVPEVLSPEVVSLCTVDLCVQAEIGDACCIDRESAVLSATILSGSALLGKPQLTRVVGSEAHLVLTGRIPVTYLGGCPTVVQVEVRFGAKDCTASAVVEVAHGVVAVLPRLIAHNSLSLLLLTALWSPEQCRAYEGPWDHLARRDPFTLVFHLEDPVGNVLAQGMDGLAAITRIDDLGQVAGIDALLLVSFDPESGMYALDLHPTELGLEPGRYAAWIGGIPQATVLMLFVVDP